MARFQIVSVVDDDDSVRESLPDLLRAFGFEVYAFATAAAFLADEVLGRTDCLVLDVTMPGMTGPELFRELRRRRRELPTVFITGQVDRALRTRLVRDGAIDCLFKPFSEAAMIGAVRSALGRG